MGQYGAVSMTQKEHELQIPEGSEIFKCVKDALLPYHAEPVGSHLFIVEGTIEEPRVGTRYPGYKLQRRVLKKPNKNSALWANLLDFEVVPFERGRAGISGRFSYLNLLKDFEMYKKDHTPFWKMVVRLHDENVVDGELPELGGVDPRQFLEMLKWMWIEEDLNYKLSWKEVGSAVRYQLQNKNGQPTSGGAGRDKFYAALILVRSNHFDSASIQKIIRLA